MMMMMRKKNVQEEIVRSKKDKNEVLDRFLITISIMGSAGPIRFVVKEKELVSNVIDIALKSYAREGRLPVLGFDSSNFILYCANATFDASNPSEQIGSYGVRNFLLFKKQGYSPTIESQPKVQSQMSQSERLSQLMSSKGKGLWKAGFIPQMKIIEFLGFQ